MNCRRVSNLLSAYLDQELAGTDMLDIRAHLSRCPACQSEHDKLRQTKRLLGSLALRAPQDAAFEKRLLRRVTRQAFQPAFVAWLPASWMTAWRQGAVAGSLTPARLRTLGTASALSVAGLLLGTITLDRAADVPFGFVSLAHVRGSGAAGARLDAALMAGLIPQPSYGVMPPYVAQHQVRQSSVLPLADPNGLIGSARDWRGAVPDEGVAAGTPTLSARATSLSAPATFDNSNYAPAAYRAR